MPYYRYRSYSPYWNKVASYLTACVECGKKTSKKYARSHNGRCKACTPSDAVARGDVMAVRRQEAERLAMMYDADCNDGETYEEAA